MRKGYTQFLLSLGAHSPHENYLLCVPRKPSLNEICLIEATFSFYFDIPCALVMPRFEKEASILNRGLLAYHKKFHGPVSKETFRPYDGIIESIEVASRHGLDSHSRLFDRLSGGETRWKMKLPKDEKVKNALFVYRLASMTTDPFARILNYWRCLESLTNLEERKLLFQKVPNIKLNPLMVTAWLDQSRFDVMKRYVNEAQLHFNHLLKKYGSSFDISEHFYKKRRCPVAHANGRPLYYNSGISFGELTRDCILLKVIVRHALETMID
jgi:hypothetical protein